VIDLPMDGFPYEMGFLTTTILAQSMPVGAPSTPSPYSVFVFAAWVNPPFGRLKAQFVKQHRLEIE
jgi:hypothetical protein